MNRPASCARLAPALALVAGACALATATPPQVEVQQVSFRGATLLDQVLTVQLCVTNPNTTALDFRRVTVGIDAEGLPLADGASETAVRLPPLRSTLVPFQVVTTVRNLGPQLLSIMRTGSIAYRIHGTVQLTGALGLTVPFNHSGQLNVLSAGQNALSYADAPAATRCGPVGS